MNLIAFVDWGAFRNGPVWQAFLAIAIVGGALAVLVSIFAGVCTLLERKIAGRMQARVGPYRVGPHGALQWIADSIKLLLKEDIIPKKTDRLLFKLAPFVVFGGAFACWVALPYGPDWSPARFNIGILYILAVSSAAVIGILMAGWASGNKWALFGAMRSAAQIVSYEVPMGLTLLGMLFIYGSLDMQEICRQQGQGVTWGLLEESKAGLFSWGIFRHLPFTIIAFLIYYISALAETNRTPFDIPEAESELVAGFHTEYSGMRFAFFFLAEYANMFVVSAIAATFFLGGWQAPVTDAAGYLTLLGGAGVGGIVGFVCRRRIVDALLGVSLGAAAGVLVTVVHPGLLGEVGIGFEIPVFIEGLFWFLAKSFFLIFVMMWLRWTLPRYRVDQLMDLCWKKLTPLAFLNLVALGLLETRHEWWPLLGSLFGRGA